MPVYEDYISYPSVCPYMWILDDTWLRVEQMSHEAATITFSYSLLYYDVIMSLYVCIWPCIPLYHDVLVYLFVFILWVGICDCVTFFKVCHWHWVKQLGNDQTVVWLWPNLATHSRTCTRTSTRGAWSWNIICHYMSSHYITLSWYSIISYNDTMCSGAASDQSRWLTSRFAIVMVPWHKLTE
jgi:hypothetical protein